MNETNGESKSWIGQQRESLNKWEQKVGLLNLSLNEEVEKYLNLTSSDRKSLTPDECANIAISISNYALYISKITQDLDSEIYLLDEKIKYIVLDRINQQNAYKFEDKLTYAIRENDEAVRMYKERIGLEAKRKRASYYANKVDNIAKSFQTLALAKKRERNYGE